MTRQASGKMMGKVHSAVRHHFKLAPSSVVPKPNPCSVLPGSFRLLKDDQLSSQDSWALVNHLYCYQRVVPEEIKFLLSRGEYKQIPSLVLSSERLSSQEKITILKVVSLELALLEKSGDVDFIQETLKGLEEEVSHARLHKQTRSYAAHYFFGLFFLSSGALAVWSTKETALSSGDVEESMGAN